MQAEFEELDESPARLGTDLVGVRKTTDQTYPAGLIAVLASGSSRIRVWRRGQGRRTSLRAGGDALPG
jgi:hypothetical protein